MKFPVYEVRKIRTLRVSDSAPKAHPRAGVRVEDAPLAIRIARSELHGLDRERLLAIYVNSQNVFVGLETTGIGIEWTCPTSMTTLFRGALLAGATGVIFAHNHPGGDPVPSPDDIDLLNKVEAAAELLGIQVVDFLIITDGYTYSDKESIRAGKDCVNR